MQNGWPSNKENTMPEYKLKLTEETTADNRQETLNELLDFMREMQGLTMSVVTLDEVQSKNWDKEGESEIDYQDYYGKQIVRQIQEFDTDAECLVIRNLEQLPVALACGRSGELDERAAWQGIGIDKRLRKEIAQMIGLDDYQLEEPINQ